MNELTDAVQDNSRERPNNRGVIEALLVYVFGFPLIAIPWLGEVDITLHTCDNANGSEFDSENVSQWPLKNKAHAVGINKSACYKQM